MPAIEIAPGGPGRRARHGASRRVTPATSSSSPAPMRRGPCSRRAARMDVDPRRLRWAAVGEATAAVLADAGVRDVFVPSAPTADALARRAAAAARRPRPACRAPTSRTARCPTPCATRGATRDATWSPTRRSRRPRPPAPLLAAALDDGPIDVLVLTSGSTARGLLALARTMQDPGRASSRRRSIAGGPHHRPPSPGTLGLRARVLARHPSPGAARASPPSPPPPSASAPTRSTLASDRPPPPTRRDPMSLLADPASAGGRPRGRRHRPSPIPRTACAGPAAPRPCARSCARRGSTRASWWHRCSCCPGRGAARARRLDARRGARDPGRGAATTPAASPRWASAASSCSGCRPTKDGVGTGGWVAGRHRPGDAAPPPGRGPRPRPDRGHLPVRVHRPRPLRPAARRRPRRQRRHDRAARAGPPPSQAEAGADIVAPQRMMDGQVAAIRRGARRRRPRTTRRSSPTRPRPPPRSTARSATRPAPRPSFGDRRGYQMDPANAREAMREIEVDIAEGADMLLVKPALPSLDILAAARARFDVPIGAYQVSGEYASIEAAAQRGWLDRRRALTESHHLDPARRRRLRDHVRRRGPRGVGAGGLLMHDRARRSPAGRPPAARRSSAPGRGPVPGRRQQPRARVPLRRAAAAHPGRRAGARASATPTAAGTSTTSARGARRSSGHARSGGRGGGPRRRRSTGSPWAPRRRARSSWASAIRAAMPSMERMRFVSSGTEAVMSAIRLARGATGPRPRRQVRRRLPRPRRQPAGRRGLGPRDARRCRAPRA